MPPQAFFSTKTTLAVSHLKLYTTSLYKFPFEQLTSTTQQKNVTHKVQYKVWMKSKRALSHRLAWGKMTEFPHWITTCSRTDEGEEFFGHRKKNYFCEMHCTGNNPYMDLLFLLFFSSFLETCNSLRNSMV